MQKAKAVSVVDGAADHVFALCLIALMTCALYLSLCCGISTAGATYSRVGATAVESGSPLPDGCVAWLSIDGPISCPVVQSGNGAAPAGAAVLDSRNAADFSDACSLVSGPDELTRFRDASYFERHRRGMLTVGDTACLLQVFAVLITDADALVPPDPDAIWLETAEEDALFYREPDGGRLLALTACADGGERIVVLCNVGEPLRRVQRLSFYKEAN